MSNKRKKVGPISVYLTREQINALLYLLDCFPAADANNKLAADAEKLKRKIMLHGRTFIFKRVYAGSQEKSVLTWQNDAHLDRLLALNEKINKGATLDSLRADMAKKEQAVREIERTISSFGTSDPMTTDKLNIALQFARQELQEAADWVTTAEQVLGGTYLQYIGNLERQRRKSEYLYNGTEPADEGTTPETQDAVPHRRR